MRRSPPKSNNQNQEVAMANQNTNDKNSRTIEAPSKSRVFPSELHQLLNMMPDEVEAEIRARGKTPESALADFDAMVSALRSKHLSNAEIIGPLFSEEDNLESLRFYEESVAAGVPMNGGGDIPYRKARGSDFFGHQDWESMFVAKVSGWSMREDHITDGDVVLVDSKVKAKDGDIVLAFIVGEGQVVKRLRLVGGDRMILESANPDFKPIVIDDPANVAIRGVIKGRAGQV